MKKKAVIAVIDGQGGKMGSLIVEQLKKKLAGVGEFEIIAIGTNSLATTAMLKAGADAGATGENPVKVICRDADIIIGPLGIVVADSLLGEVTPEMAVAIGQSKAEKLLIPVNRCNNYIIGIRDIPLGEYIALTVEKAASLI